MEKVSQGVEEKVSSFANRRSHCFLYVWHSRLVHITCGSIDRK